MAAKSNSVGGPTLVMDHSKAVIGLPHYVAIWFWLGSFTLYFYLLLGGLPLLWRFAPRALACLLVVMAASGLHSVQFKKAPDWAIGVGNWAIFKANEYLQMKMYAEDAEALMQRNRPVIFALEPHDILPLSMAALSDAVQVFPGIRARGCVTSIAYKIPILKHVFTWVGSGSIDKENVVDMISKGESPMICVGGAHEVIYMENSSEYVLYMSPRLGYVKIAMQQGVDIVPMFAFGQRNLWDYYIPSSTWLHSLGRKIGFIPLIYTGMWGLPLAPPKAGGQVTVVLGAPVEIPKIAEPTPEQLAEYALKVIECVQRIFEENKDKNGAAGCTLKIL